MSERKVYFNGELVPAGQAKIDIGDPGFLHGASTFTTMLARNGVVFRFEQHLARLAETVRLLNLRAEATTGELVTGTYAVLDENHLADARCRITLTPGPAEGKPTTLITAEPLPSYPPEWYEKGIGVVVSACKQSGGDPIYGLKTGCYLPRLLARQDAAAKGFEDALWFTHDNLLAESCYSNVFLLLDGVLCTPPLNTPVLPGVVRQAVLELCRANDIPCTDEEPLTVDDMLRAEEIFLTSSCMGIRPVVRIERHAVGEETPGELTRCITALYQDLLEAETGQRQSITEADHEGA